MTRRYAAPIVAVGIVPCSALFGWLSRSHGGTFNWDDALLAATAYGTLALAFATWRLVSSARQDAAGTLRLAKLGERAEEVRMRPFVYPYSNRWLEPLDGALHALPLQNGGEGVAMNVTGQLYWPAGNAALSSTTLYHGDNVQLPLRSPVPVVGEGWGLLRYRDLLGREWETRFMLETGPDGKVRPIVCAYGIAELLPQQAYPAGWEMPGGVPRVALPER